MAVLRQRRPVSDGPTGVRHMRLARLPIHLPYPLTADLVDTLLEHGRDGQKQKQRSPDHVHVPKMRRRPSLLSLQEHVAHLRPSSSWQRHRTHGQQRPFLFVHRECERLALSHAINRA